MLFVYGTKILTKFKGYFGAKEECPNCHKTYTPAFVKVKTWAHFDYLPIFPIKTRYYKMCPVCGVNHELKTKEAKPLMINKDENQNTKVYIKHVLHNKPEKKLQTDTSYELWFKDNITNEELCVSTGLTKKDIKTIKKNRGLKTIDIIDVE
ncbi:MAG: hypothetical protein VZS44_02225 [Bacilli bacterium]|nr:hypothetical protein [Bacilli bacterium]